MNTCNYELPPSSLNNQDKRTAILILHVIDSLIHFLRGFFNFGRLGTRSNAIQRPYTRTTSKRSKLDQMYVG